MRAELRNEMLRVLEESFKGDSEGIILLMGDNPLTFEAVRLLEEYGALWKNPPPIPTCDHHLRLRLLPETEDATDLLGEEKLVSCSRSYHDQCGDSGYQPDGCTARLI